MKPLIFRSPLALSAFAALSLVGGLTAAAGVAAPPAGKAAADRDPLVDTVANGKGRVNYSVGLVKATGYGALPQREGISGAQAKLMALGAARADALRTLAMMVSSIQVTATTRVKNYELDSDVVETRLSALLQAPKVVSETLQADGTAVVVLELPLYGANSVASAVLPEVLPQSAEESVSAADPNSAYGTAPVVSAPGPGTWLGPTQPAIRLESRPARPATINILIPEPGPTPLSDNGPFTSLVVDCRGLNIEAIMSPKLMDTTGREIYGTVRVTPEYAIETGIVGYPRSMGEALRGARAGSHPLIVKALRANDKFRFNPCIALEDGDRILAANNRDHFLEATRVIFLVDPLK
ncbi:MAG: hypothetical protein H7Z41_16335 [Cytophagales bacterium]|nr:hypothetical protein [Armatimonadota bacterium]